MKFFSAMNKPMSGINEKFNYLVIEGGKQW